MYETDYEFAYEYNNESYTYDLDEMCEYLMRDTYTHIQDAYEMDDEYARDSCDYNELHISIMHDTIRKHRTRFTCTHTNAL